MEMGYILIYTCSYHGNRIYLEYVPIVPFDVRYQSGIYIKYSTHSTFMLIRRGQPSSSCFMFIKQARRQNNVTIPLT